MKFFKWSLIALFFFGVSAIIIKSISQDVFTAPARVWFFWQETPSFPVYWYVFGMFVFGLLVGLAVAGYYYTRLAVDRSKKNRRIQHLEHEMETLNKQIASLKEVTSEPSSS